MKFSDVFAGVAEAAVLDRLVDENEQAPILFRMGDPEIALRVIRSSVRSSYLFNRYTMPSYASHLFGALSLLPPVDDELGPILAGVAGAIKGELFNNNVYGRPKECHSHYHDMLTSYEAAGGDPAVVATEGGGGKKDYADHLLETLKNRLATFVLVPAIEKSTPKFFETVAANLSDDPRFAKYRQFVEKHIELDRTEHSCVTMDWLAYFVGKVPPPAYEVRVALRLATKAIALGRGRSVVSAT